jgi:choloylglycine hydrolase
VCTAIKAKNLFGRTLDLEYSYNESVILTPRKYEFNFRYEKHKKSRFSMIGIGIEKDEFPLYYDAANERGLYVAALNFPYSTRYRNYDNEKKNCASYELIPWLLSECQSVKCAKEYLKDINITNDSFAEDLPYSPLHFFVADSNEAIVLESTEHGIEIFDNPYNVLTNEPPFSFHKENASHYMALSPHQPKNMLCPNTDLSLCSFGMGSSGLPGGASSTARFVRALYANSHTLSDENDCNHISRFFHIADWVSVPYGASLTADGAAIKTVYTSCFDANEKIMYFTTYKNRRIRAVKLNTTDSNFEKLLLFSLDGSEDVLFRN